MPPDRIGQDNIAKVRTRLERLERPDRSEKMGTPARLDGLGRLDRPDQKKKTGQERTFTFGTKTGREGENLLSEPTGQV